MNDDALLPVKDVCKRVGLGRTRIYELCRAKRFPQPTLIGSSARWSANEINGWIADRLAEREARTA